MAQANDVDDSAHFFFEMSRCRCRFSRLLTLKIEAREAAWFIGKSGTSGSDFLSSNVGGGIYYSESVINKSLFTKRGHRKAV